MFRDTDCREMKSCGSGGGQIAFIFYWILISFTSVSQNSEEFRLFVFQGDIDSSLSVDKYINPIEIDYYLVDVPFFEIEFLKAKYTSNIDTNDSSFPGMHFFIESFFDTVKMKRLYGFSQWAYQYPFYKKKLDDNALKYVAEILDSEKCKSSHKPASGLSKLMYDFSLPPEMIDSLINLFDSNLTPIQEKFMRYYYDFPDNEFGTKPDFWLCSGLFEDKEMAVFTDFIGPCHKNCYSAQTCNHVFIKPHNKRKYLKEVKKKYSISKQMLKTGDMIKMENGDLLQVHFIR